jgi:site-specific DNA recombinase
MTPVDGLVTDLVDGVRAVVDSQQLEDLKHATRRGMAGLVRDALSAGGRAYGYETVPGDKGRLVIVEEQRAVVLRIFEEWVRGETARSIAHGLNADRIPTPRGNAWNASTIYGNRKRGNGIIRNHIYVGRIVWNKVGMMKDPDTGKRISRPNPTEAWVTTEVPELAIVPVELFEAAQWRLAERKDVAPPFQRKARRLLSGLLRCAACGSGMSTYGKEAGGRKRVRCTRDAESGTCPNPRTFYLDTIEASVLDALGDELRNPKRITEFVRIYHEERRGLAAKDSAQQASAERRLGDVRREIARIVDGVSKGTLDPAIFGPRASELDAERKKIESTLSENQAQPVVTLHPGALKHYEAMVANLQKCIEAGMTEGNREYNEAIREMVETVTVRPGSEPGRLEVEIEGTLTALLGPEAFPNGRKGVAGLMVAGAGLEPATSGL